MPLSNGTNDCNLASWFHYLCKNVGVETTQDEKGNEVDTIRSTNVRNLAGAQSQADFSWIRSGYFLKSELPTIKSVSGSDATLIHGIPDSKNVSLICFGASPALKTRFERLSSSHCWEEVLNDPYVLFDIVTDELWLQLDGTAWALSRVFGGIENVSVFTAFLSSC